MLKILAKLAAAILLLIGLLVAWNWSLVVALMDTAKVSLEEPEWSSIDNETTLIQFLAAHRDDFGLVIQTVDEQGAVIDEPLAHRADEPHVLASTVKIVVLSAVARAIDEGAWSAGDEVSTDAWESWYVEGSDGGAHPAAYDRLGIEHAAGRASTPQDVTILQLAEAMIRNSDNAATDLLIDRLGDRMAAETALLGHDPVEPLFADTLDVFWPDAEGDYRDPSFRSEITSQSISPVKFSVQRTILAGSMASGTPRTYAKVLAGVAARSWISPTASEFMAGLLDWPMEQEWNQKAFHQFGTKGGSVPGVFTEAIYLAPKAGDHPGELRVGALFLNRLSGSAWLSLGQTYMQQQLLVTMLVDDATLNRVIEALK